MASRMLGNLLVRFRGGLFVMNSWSINPVIGTQIIYPYLKDILIK
ncbi:hypothetical protein [Candidatus Phytoplasma bonamiae]|uniref:Uncharacterized protein n=1 Tax=Candidatus Phytoplasma bonamiae TaxID=2982626 RepID=A0ABT9D3V0_9MOLU|nr:hypothetical protein ['Bonamia sp.' little leaf phytoplasma]MDO8064116.1 hypothetical protein ['Bonamia sp.' little leaf phytoplasma]MDV3174495.1 hypothetical protein ['Bonamia sp.' little leaf phytoplasma]